MYANAKVPDRKYLWTVVSLFTLLGLLGLGVLLYKPLHLRYAVYKVQHTTWEQWCRDFKEGKDHAYARCLEECTAAACQGNRTAMEAVIDASGFGDGYIAEMTCEVAYKVAAHRPQAFFETLGRRQPQRIREVLADIIGWIYFDSGEDPPAGQGNDADPCALKSIVGELEKHAKSKNPEVRRVATAALDFTRRRFAKELAEAKRKP